MFVGMLTQTTYGKSLENWETGRLAKFTRWVCCSLSDLRHLNIHHVGEAFGVHNVLSLQNVLITIAVWSMFERIHVLDEYMYMESFWHLAVMSGKSYDPFLYLLLKTAPGVLTCSKQKCWNMIDCRVCAQKHACVLWLWVIVMPSKYLGY